MPRGDNLSSNNAHCNCIKYKSLSVYDNTLHAILVLFNKSTIVITLLGALFKIFFAKRNKWKTTLYPELISLFP